MPKELEQRYGCKWKYNQNRRDWSCGVDLFFPSKNLGCYGDGGAIITNDDDLAHNLRGIVNHGMYERYHHDVVGVNSHLDSLQAVVLNEKLKLLDYYNERRKWAAIRYSQLLQGITISLLPM